MPRSDQLIKTKFFVPQLTGDHIVRCNLAIKLDAIKDYNFTLVTSPAGFGKSTLVASWLQHQSLPHAWLSLDENDDNIYQFLRYFIEAVRSIDELFGKEVIQLLNASDPPSDEIIISQVLNEIAEIQGSMIMVLDDFHFIRQESILTFLKELIKHPAPALHLVLITRSDPNLPLHTLRLSGKILELRARDLVFKTQETAQLIVERFDIQPSDVLIHSLLEITEGWIAGLKLLIISVDNYNELDTKLDTAKHSDVFQVKFLVEDYLNSLGADLRKIILTACIFDKFSAELCTFINRETKPSGEEIDGKTFIEKLASAGMFIIPLDSSNEWYRFHHLFLDLLSEKMQKEFSMDEISELHYKSSEWFERKGFTQMAIKHALQAGSESHALDLFKQYRITLLNIRSWQEHEYLLHMFSNECMDHSPVLLLSRSWINIYHGKMKEAFDLISDISKLLKAKGPPSADDKNLKGEVNTIASYYYYYRGEAKEAVRYSQAAIDQLEVDNSYPLGLAWIFLGGGYQMMGKSDQAIAIIYKALESAKSDLVKSSLFLILNYIHWLNGNLPELKSSGFLLGKHGRNTNNQESKVYGDVFIGHYYYQIDQLELAEEHYDNANQYRYHSLGSIRTHFLVGHAMTCFELGNRARADLILEELEGYVAESGNEYMIKMISLAKAEMEFRKGEIEKAFQLTQNINSLPLRPVTNFFAPQLIKAKIWIYYKIPSCNEEASVLLDETESYLLKVNNTRFLIDLYALKSIYNFDTGNLEISMKYLEKSVKLARPGGFIRVFTDMGEKMREVILASTMSTRDDKYIDQVLSSFKKKIIHAPVEALSLREEEILQYLSQKLSNKEIGTKLFITEKTVKNHLNRIYRKLDVSGRREALNKAREKDLLQN